MRFSTLVQLILVIPGAARPIAESLNAHWTGTSPSYQVGPQLSLEPRHLARRSLDFDFKEPYSLLENIAMLSMYGIGAVGIPFVHLLMFSSTNRAFRQQVYQKWAQFAKEAAGDSVLFAQALEKLNKQQHKKYLVCYYQEKVRSSARESMFRVRFVFIILPLQVMRSTKRTKTKSIAQSFARTRCYARAVCGHLFEDYLKKHKSQTGNKLAMVDVIKRYQEWHSGAQYFDAKCKAVLDARPKDDQRPVSTPAQVERPGSAPVTLPVKHENQPQGEVVKEPAAASEPVTNPDSTIARPPPPVKKIPKGLVEKPRKATPAPASSPGSSSSSLGQVGSSSPKPKLKSNGQERLSTSNANLPNANSAPANGRRLPRQRYNNNGHYNFKSVMTGNPSQILQNAESAIDQFGNTIRRSASNSPNWLPPFLSSLAGAQGAMSELGKSRWNVPKPGIIKGLP